MNLALGSFLLLALAYVRGASGAEILVPAATAKTVGDIVRRELILRITNNFNRTVQAQMDMAHACETKINGSVTACQTCINNTPGQSGAAPDIGTIIKVAVLNPIGTELENFFKGIASDLKLGKLKDVMGDKFGEFGNILENIAESAGDFFKDTAISAVGEAKTFFKNIGSTFKSVGNGIKKAVTSINIKTVGTDIVSGLGHFGKNIGSGLGNVGKNIGSGLENVGKTIGSGLTTGVKSIGRGFKKFTSWFGRRKREADFGRFRRGTSCPICDQINPDENTNDQIISAVCGPTFQADLDALSAKVTAMIDLYEWAKDSTIAQHILLAYDSADAGAAQFTGGHLSVPVSPFRVLFKGKEFTSTRTMNLVNAAAVAPEIAEEIYNRVIGA